VCVCVCVRARVCVFYIAIFSVDFFGNQTIFQILFSGNAVDLISETGENDTSDTFIRITYMCVCVCVCVCMYIYAYACVCVYTYTHIQSDLCLPTRCSCRLW